MVWKDLTGLTVQAIDYQGFIYALRRGLVLKLWWNKKAAKRGHELFAPLF
jgi:hypothetical protein